MVLAPFSLFFLPHPYTMRRHSLAPFSQGVCVAHVQCPSTVRSATLSPQPDGWTMSHVLSAYINLFLCDENSALSSGY